MPQKAMVAVEHLELDDRKPRRKPPAGLAFFFALLENFHITSGCTTLAASLLCSTSAAFDDVERCIPANTDGASISQD